MFRYDVVGSFLKYNFEVDNMAQRIIWECSAFTVNYSLLSHTKKSHNNNSYQNTVTKMSLHAKTGFKELGTT